MRFKNPRIGLGFLSYLLSVFALPRPVLAVISGNDSAFCNGYTQINSAIGCIPVNSSADFLSALIRWAMGVSGGVAFILIVVAGFQLATSAGDPKRAAAAQQLLTAALSGLILITLSVVILNFFGVEVLSLNQLGFNQ